MPPLSTVLASRFAEALATAARERGWSGELLPVEVERPTNPALGDYATNLAMRHARPLRRPPLDIAREVAERVAKDELIDSVEVAQPGFINVRLRPAWVARQADEIVRAESGFGRADTLKGTKVQVEFVSANPTGPLTLANARGGPLGDVLASVLAFVGADVEREYYVEDTGTQIELLGRSVAVRYRQLFGEDVELPPEGYPGDYVRAIAEEIRRREGDRYRGLSLDEQAALLAPLSVEWVVADIKRVSEKFGIRYDHWFRQSTFMGSGYFRETLEELRRRGRTFEKDGAIWFHDETLKTEDREGIVVVRSNGEPTYFGKDIAYHRLCFFERGLGRKIDIWGANTHFHLIRMRPAMAALGIGEDRWQVVLYQYVRWLKEGTLLRMGKRLGQFVTLEDVLDGVGVDAARFFLLQRSADAPLDFDFELAQEQSNENPVYYVQYAHARIASIFRTARERGIEWGDADVALLTERGEQELLLACLRFPDLVAEIARHYGVHLLTQYGLELAGMLHSFYKFNRVISDDLPRTRARLRLMEAVQVALRQTLGLLGIAAPDHM